MFLLPSPAFLGKEILIGPPAPPASRRSLPPIWNVQGTWFFLEGRASVKAQCLCEVQLLARLSLYIR